MFIGVRSFHGEDDGDDAADAAPIDVADVWFDMYLDQELR